MRISDWSSDVCSSDLFGVPPAKLLQWLQLQRAVRALVSGEGLADAAAAGGFADQSHFTRRCAQWLGVPPSAGLSAFAFETVPCAAHAYLRRNLQDRRASPPQTASDDPRRAAVQP